MAFTYLVNVDDENKNDWRNAQPFIVIYLFMRSVDAKKTIFAFDESSLEIEFIKSLIDQFSVIFNISVKIESEKFNAVLTLKTILMPPSLGFVKQWNE